MIEVTVRTPEHRVLVDITDRVARAIQDSAEGEGIWLVRVPHTTAGITINEGADPAVARDILMAWERVAPEDLAYEHAEGNSPAHVLASVAGSSVLVPFEDGDVQLGTWQSIFLCEFDGPRTRRVSLRKL
ncbi:MAG TPA: secondary thiamine-phosphate synthase enzyme YjbQ [Gemmatimonadota bacterium]|nr:secondary thiamine-phosphate synthase enzyme YjbQ [Gemmatimonadota bacterium]